KGRTLDVVTNVTSIKGVKKACVITGTFDVVATFEVKDVSDVGEMVARGIDSVDGVSLTQTAICVKCCSK
ncbi:MAG: Lrp/AsnC ligand binding domain-containing protein, partial [Candidatus Bathyarchaeota archaeon]